MIQVANAAPIKKRTTLVDITKCIGCRACQVACKQWNDREGEETELNGQLGFQNPATLSSKTYTLISFHELENPQKASGLDAADPGAGTQETKACLVDVVKSSKPSGGRSESQGRKA